MEDVERHVKDLIINKYGSLKKFCEIINMPWTTLDSILKRGFTKSNITNVMKIASELDIDVESLAKGEVISKKMLPADSTEYPVDYIVHGIGDDEYILIEQYRKSDLTTKEMIRRLLAYCDDSKKE